MRGGNGKTPQGRGGAAGEAPQDDEQKKKIELLQKQIETLRKDDQAAGRPAQEAAAGRLEKLEAQAATLEARSVQAAHRDQELAGAVDDLREHHGRPGAQRAALPAQLKELFLPSGNNETPLSIYGALAVGYSKILGDTATAANGAGRAPTPGGFYFGEFTPDFLLKLNDWIFLEAEIGIGSDGSVERGLLRPGGLLRQRLADDHRRPLRRADRLVQRAAE